MARRSGLLAAAWACLLAGAWLTGLTALPALVACWCACIHIAPRAVRRLGPAPQAALVSCGLALAGLHALRNVTVPAWLAPPPPPGEATRRERQRDVVRSIARHLATAEAAWKRERAGDRGDEARADAAEGSP